MTTFDVHYCPRCELRFTNASEVHDHLDRDHLDREHLDQAQAETVSRGRMVVPVDPTKRSGVAIRVGATMARAAGMDLELVAAVPPGLDEPSTSANLRSRLQSLPAPDGSRHSTLGRGEPATAIVDHVAPDGSETGPTVICMDSRSRGPIGEMVLGSVSEDVVRRAAVPVLLCGPNVRPAAGYDRFIVALDGSHLAQDALSASLPLAEALGVELQLVEVVDPKVSMPPDVSETAYLSALAASTHPAPSFYDTLHGKDPAAEIVKAADNRASTVIVVGSHGRGGAERLRLGSVALDVVREAPCPVLVVPATATARR